MLKKYFKPAPEEVKEAEEKIKPKKRGRWNRIWEDMYQENPVTAAGSNFDEMNMTHGVTVWEGYKNKSGSSWIPYDTISRT